MIIPDKLRAAGLTVKDMCERLSISRPTFYAIVNNNMFPATRWGIIVSMCNLYGRVTNRKPKKIFMAWAERNWDEYAKEASEGRDSDNE